MDARADMRENTLRFVIIAATKVVELLSISRYGGSSLSSLSDEGFIGRFIGKRERDRFGDRKRIELGRESHFPGRAASRCGH